MDYQVAFDALRDILLWFIFHFWGLVEISCNLKDRVFCREWNSNTWWGLYGVMAYWQWFMIYFHVSVSNCCPQLFSIIQCVSPIVYSISQTDHLAHMSLLCDSSDMCDIYSQVVAFWFREGHLSHGLDRCSPRFNSAVMLCSSPGVLEALAKRLHRLRRGCCLRVWHDRKPLWIFDPAG